MKMLLAATVNQMHRAHWRFKKSTILPGIALVVDLHYYNQDIKAMGLHSG